MKTKTLLIMVACSLILPVMAEASDVSWTSESYRAYAYAEENNPQQEEVFGPPLPISANAYDFIVDADSTVTASSIVVGVNRDATYGFLDPHYANALGEFAGTYTATAAYFLFSYSYDYFNGTSPSTAGNRFWISVDDMTTSSNLYSKNVSFSSSTSSGPQNIYLDTVFGNQISVNFGIEAETIWGSGPDDWGGVSLSYNTAVVPEPISSILFVTGGSLLAGRRFIRRKA